MKPNIPEAPDAGLMRSSVAYFAYATLRGPQQAPYNGRFLVSAHHEAWDDLVWKHKRLCVLSARDSGKTFFFDFAYPLWKAAHQPNGRGYIFSATQDQAVRILSDIKDELEDNPKLAHLVPHFKETWSKTAIKLANGHRIFARGYGTKIRGAHPDWIVVDDGLNDEDGYSELVRQKHIDYFFTAISNMIIPGGQIVVVGTPFNAMDLYAEIAKNPEYVFRKFPALSKDNKPLWPERYDLAALLKKRREIGSVRFTREFQCEPVSDDMSIFPGRLFVGEPVEQYVVKLGSPMSVWTALGVTGVFIGVDLAISTSTGADYFVVFVMGTDRHGNRWVMDIFRKKGMPYQQQISVIQAMGKKYNADLIFIESNQMQRVVGDDLIRMTDLPIKKFNTTGRGKGVLHPTTNTVSANKNTLEGGVPALRILLENQKFRIPRGDAHSVEMTDIWINEMRGYSWVNGKLQGVGGHDDTTMACVPPGHLVTTQRGPVAIEQVVVGDEVLTHRSRFRKVTSVMHRHHDGEVCTLHPTGSPDLSLTGEHPVYAAGARHRHEDRTNCVIPTEWGFHAAVQLQAGARKRGQFVWAPHAPRTPTTSAVDLSGLVDLTKPVRGGLTWRATAEHVWWRADRKLPRWLSLADPDVAFLLGLYLAEGSTGGGGGVRKARRHMVCFALHERETHIAAFVASMAAKHFAAPCLRIHAKDTRGMVATIHSSVAAALFKQLGVHADKGLPSVWEGLPQEVLLWIVRGWLVGDGSMPRKGSCHMQGVTIAPRLAHQVVSILRAAGIRCAMRTASLQGSGTRAWVIRVPSTEASKLLVGMNRVERIRWRQFRRETKNGNIAQVVFPSGHALKLQKVERRPYSGMVHNLQVEEDESYVVEGIAVHNCWISDQAVRAGGFSFSTGEEEQADLQTLIREQTDEAPVPEGPSEEEQARTFLEGLTGAEPEELSNLLNGEFPKAPGNLVDDEEVGGVAESVWNRLPGLSGRF